MERGSTPRAAETVAGVLAALAIEQIAQGSIEAFTRADHPTAWEWYVELVLVGLGLMAVGVRFFHGNATYLDARYKRWDPDEVPAHAWVATPFRHMLDVFTHVLEYAALLGAGYFLARDSSFRASCIWVSVLLGIDVLWLAASWVVDAAEPSTPLGRTQRKWFFANLATLFLIVVIFAQADGMWLGATLATVLWVSTAVDYVLNYRHYFAAGKAADSVSAEMASTAVQYVATLLGAHFGPTGKGSLRENLQSALAALFAFFMANAPNRQFLFHRRAAHLHVGLYVEHEGELRPVFRYADPLIVKNLRNRSFRIGEGYIGQAFLFGRDGPGYVVTYDQPVAGPLALLDPATRRVDKREKFYKSSIVTNVYWPGTNGAFGTLLLTASEPSYFTPEVHEAMLIGISRCVSIRLSQLCGPATAREASAKIVEAVGKDPIVISGVPKEAAK